MIEHQGNNIILSSGSPSVLWLNQPLGGGIRIRLVASQESHLNDISLALSANRAAGFRSGYEFKLGAYDNSVDLFVRQEERLWHRKSTSIKPGHKHTIELERVDRHIRVWLDQELIVDVEDTVDIRGDAVALTGWNEPITIHSFSVERQATPPLMDPINLADNHFANDRIKTAHNILLDLDPLLMEVDRSARYQDLLWRIEQRIEFDESINSAKHRILKRWPKAIITILKDYLEIDLEVTRMK